MLIPIPGRPVRGSKTGQPVMALFDLLGRSWAMGIIWNLHDGACNFRELEARCQTVSPTTLNKRLKELTESFLVRKTADGYALTTAGEQLYQLINPIGKWAKGWALNFKKAGTRGKNN